MSEFKQYRRKSVSEMRDYEEGEMLNSKVSISDADLKAGSPKLGDMIARNPKNHEDQWLVAKAYFEDNLEPIEINDSVADVSDFDSILNDFRQWQAKWDLYSNKKTFKKPESSDDFIVEMKSKYLIN
jgi:uncharacterized protein YozE (UPF0346 family)